MTKGLFVSKMMNGVLLHADVSDNLLNLTRLLVAYNADAILVRERGMPKGLISAENIVKGLVLKDDLRNVLASEIMTHPLITIDHEADLNDVRLKMLEQGVKKLPVKKDVDIIGLVLETDFIREISWLE